MIGEERAPGLRRRSWTPFQQARHRPFRDVDPEGAQFPVNPRGSAQRVGVRHRSDEGADLRINARAAAERSRPTGPLTAEPVAMPSHDGVGLNEDQHRAPIPPESGQDDPK